MTHGYLKFHTIILLLCFTMNSLCAQNDCVLGVGITKNETLMEVFQLNRFQTEKLINLSAELKYRNELLNNQAERILEQNPQETTEELFVLAQKYNEVMDSMEYTQLRIDKKILRLFNEKQYQRYLELCNEVLLQPYKVTPKVYLDSVSRN